MHQKNDNKILVDIIAKLGVGDEFFWIPDRLVPFEHWVGHIPFVFWLMKVSKPSRFVELGTHRGNSYCAMCQAVANLQLGSTGTAVDTWEGDVHMEREDGLFDEVRSYHDPKYSGFSTLLRATFDNARSYFSDQSIDLLHIDGTHTYEAVRHDFESWKSAMSDRGIVLFHDIEVRRDDFGVWKLWEELSAQYPSFDFKHSHGLGIIAIGPNYPDELHALFDLAKDSQSKARVQALFSSRGAALVSQLVLSRTEDAFENQIDALKNEADSLLSQIDKMQNSNDMLDEANCQLKAIVESQKEALVAYNSKFESCRQKIENLQFEVAQLSAARAAAEQALYDISTSTSWILTAPVRSGLIRFPKLARLGRGMVKGTWWAITGQLPARMKARKAFFDSTRKEHKRIISASRLRIVPYYLDPNPRKRGVPVLKSNIRVAVHVHLYYEDMLQSILERLRNIPVKFDLFISTHSESATTDIRKRCGEVLGGSSRVFVEIVPNRGRDVAPLIVQFGEKLAQYDIFGHFHTKKSPHNLSLSNWSAEIFDLLLGQKGDEAYTIIQIFHLLQTRAKVVIPQELTHIVRDPKGWSENFNLAREIIAKYTNFSLDDDITIDFPEGFMFWARGNALQEFLKLPLTYNDFPPEPIGNDGTIAHALERLILLFAERAEGDIFRLYRTDSIKDYRYYENQQNFAVEVEKSDVKVLTYFLPQFHPTPENDEWHGKGFTEWTKVRAANPLFEGHYQQHIPHDDIGYYLLDGPQTLYLQADQMKKSGVHGQIFYHYWFGGKLILERPVQILLEHKEIPMPFCFCWANENWTKRWDGNESEVLLGQKYSAEDAEAFIRYLIPFFKDERYIKVDERPLLFVYRPSHIENAREYVRIWGKICVEEGLKEPYIVAVLTRGATNPIEFDMDAGVERVLHDWTDGAVPEMKDELCQYVPMGGSVLSYKKVAEFYSSQVDAKEFSYMRSVVPMWDNTPRYNETGIMLHGGTPLDFQQWLESAISYSRLHLRESERFVVVNAWNEWAEGAHLEPDTKHGYAYLNSVGRALVGKAYSDDLNAQADIPPGMSINLSVPDYICDGLERDPVLAEKFLRCLNASTIFKCARVSLSSPRMASFITDSVPCSGDEADITIEFRAPCLFPNDSLELMVRTALETGSTVIPNYYGYDKEFLRLTENGSVTADSLYVCPITVMPRSVRRNGITNIRMRTDAGCFFSWPSLKATDLRPNITVIIRVHNSAELNELRNALYSLYAMIGCNVFPMIAAQDLRQEKIAELESLLREFSANDSFRSQVIHFSSPDGKSDIRSKMLNEAVRAVRTRYVSFLDYDDLMLPTAFEWFTERLKNTGKAISFGRVYVTRYSAKKRVFIERMRYFEHGYSYEEFVENNFAPLHSFMLDLERIDIQSTAYFDDHKFMEDYYLMLQLVTRENTDWESLKVNRYVGDYIHSVDRSHTLARVYEVQESSVVESDPEFLICSERIRKLRVDKLIKDELR